MPVQTPDLHAFFRSVAKTLNNSTKVEIIESDLVKQGITDQQRAPCWSRGVDNLSGTINHQQQIHPIESLGLIHLAVGLKQLLTLLIGEIRPQTGTDNLSGLLTFLHDLPLVLPEIKQS